MTSDVCPKRKRSFARDWKPMPRSCRPIIPFLRRLWPASAACSLTESAPAEAIPLLRRAVQIAQATMPSDSPTLAIARISLASALAATHSYDEAESLLRDSYPIVIKTQAETSAVVRQARKTQADLERARAEGHQADQVSPEATPSDRPVG